MADTIELISQMISELRNDFRDLRKDVWATREEVQDLTNDVENMRDEVKRLGDEFRQRAKEDIDAIESVKEGKTFLKFIVGAWPYIVGAAGTAWVVFNFFFNITPKL